MRLSRDQTVTLSLYENDARSPRGGIEFLDQLEE